MLFPSFPSFCNGISASEELLLQLEHRVGNPGEPVGVKTPLGWTIVQLILGELGECQPPSHA